MKNECSIVRDVLPLYTENMVSEDTAAFVKEHIEGCAGCAAEFETMKADEKNGNADGGINEQRKHDADALSAIKRKLLRNKGIAMGITAVCLVALAALLYLYPVYHIVQVGGTSYYSESEIAKLIYIGSYSDRAEAQAILRQADAAFGDCGHTRAENEELYGELARYATSSERGAAYTNYSLELWSAHLDDTEGCLWVYYSRETFDSEGNIITGSWKIPSLWRVERDESGVWVVVDIKEHP